MYSYPREFASTSRLQDFMTFSVIKFDPSPLFSHRYWIIENEQPEKIPDKAETLYPLLSSLPFLVKFLIFGRVLNTSTAELRVFCVSDDKTEKSLEKSQGFVEIARSRDIEVYGEQELLVQCAEASLLGNKALKIRFRPFKENRLAFKVGGVNSTGPLSYRVAFISSLKQDANGRVPLLCTLDAVLPENVSSVLKFDLKWHHHGSQETK